MAGAYRDDVQSIMLISEEILWYKALTEAKEQGGHTGYEKLYELYTNMQSETYEETTQLLELIDSALIWLLLYRRRTEAVSVLKL
jgi:hypothetical protein